MIGAIFSKFSDKTTEAWYWFPAMFAMCLAVSDVLFVFFCLKETLPKVKMKNNNNNNQVHVKVSLNY